tara:strand:+ start:661 stop:969 length:309 start_codon:yes stop_codon:yes gene_type:complete
MITQNKILLAGMVIVGIAYVYQPANAETASAAVLANTCYSCHGTNGKSVGDMPTIAGKTKNFIVDKLKAFKSGAKSSTVMMRITKGFSDSELDAISGIIANK